jgi:hypothetical protein
MDEDLKRLIEETGAATHRRFDEAVGELRQENVATRQHFDDVASDMRRHFDVTVEDFRHQVQLVAEGVDSVINERVDGLISDIKNEFAETKAMMKFSFSDVDRRLRSLEERVERLESSRTQ